MTAEFIPVGWIRMGFFPGTGEFVTLAEGKDFAVDDPDAKWVACFIKGEEVTP